MAEFIPMRWPEVWKDPSRLEILKGTPVNCLVGETPPPFPTGDLQFLKLSPERPPDGVTLREGVWPRVIPPTKKEAGAGPTGGAWVDSNSWVVRLAQLLDPGKTVWLAHKPPTGKEVAPLDDFAKPISEAEAFGAHWVVTLDDFFAGQLAQSNERAIAQWNRMTAAMKFFQAKREWRTWQPVASLAVISTFEGDFKLISEEFLNLAPRRHLAYRAMRVEDAAKSAFAGYKAVIYLEADPPAAELGAKLLEFANAGGTLVVPLGTVKTPIQKRLAEHSVRKHGKGQVAMPLERWEDPFTLVDQVHVLMSHREDDARVWNADDMDLYYQSNQTGSKAVVHLVNYTSGPARQVVLGLRKPYRSVRVSTTASQKTVVPVRSGLGIEVALGDFTDYAAVELEA